MKLQVIGARGMLGSAVLQAAGAAKLDVVAHFYGDITTCAVLGDVVINCAGLVKQRQALDSEFIMVNSFGPQRLAELCDGAGARLIQVSTDCVFAGPGPHDESSVPDGRGIYAVSKLAGEVTRAPHLTIRTSFVGWGERGLLRDLAAQRGQTVQASAHARWTGHTAPAIAQLLVDLAARPDITGLLHVPAPWVARPNLIYQLTVHYGININLQVTEDPAEDRRLSSARWDALGLNHLPPFYRQLADMPAPEGVLS